MNRTTGIIKADFNNGIFKGKYKYLVMIIVTALITNNFIRSTVSYFNYTQNPKQISLLECVMYIFRGMKEYVPSENTIFDLPITFVLTNVYLAFLIGNYAVKDISEYGRLIFIKTGSRTDWWISKCIWNVLTVASFYVSVLIGVLVGWIINIKNISGLFELDSDVVIYILQGGRMEIQDVIMFLGMLFFISVAISLLQMMLELIISPVISFCIIVSVYVSSGYYMSNYLLGNHIMLIRYRQMDNTVGLIIAVVTAIISIMGGRLIMKKRDLM